MDTKPLCMHEWLFHHTMAFLTLNQATEERMGASYLNSQDKDKTWCSWEGQLYHNLLAAM